MKKFMNLLTMAMFAVLAISFTSCDDDEYIARTLEGTWKGDMYVSTYWNNQYYDASYTEVCFLRDPYTYSSGNGYWVDYYDSNYWGSYDYVANHIYWTVQNGVIRIEFIEDGGYVDIYDYRLNDDYFTGSIDLGDQWREFRLYHVSSPNWNNYYWNGYDYYYDSYYYTNENGIGFEKAPRKANAASGDKPKRVFRDRNAE